MKKTSCEPGKNLDIVIFPLILSEMLMVPLSISQIKVLNFYGFLFLSIQAYLHMLGLRIPESSVTLFKRHLQTNDLSYKATTTCLPQA